MSMAYKQHPFLATLDEIIQLLATHLETGLSPTQVQAARAEHGSNILHGEGAIRWYRILLKQATNAMILVLLLAMAISYAVTDYIEAGVITAVIFLNISIGFYQEFKAEKKMNGLRSLSSPSANVIRESEEITIPAGEVVPGDIVHVRTGDVIPADLRITRSMNFECDEQILTGEAIPSAKSSAFSTVGRTELDTGIGDRLNMAYASSTVTRGMAMGIAVFTGMSTEIGQVAGSLQRKNLNAGRSVPAGEVGLFQSTKGLLLQIGRSIGSFLGLTSGTPLQQKLSKLAYILFGCAIVLAIVVFGSNHFVVTNEVAIYAISTGIAIIPESLIAVLTITMVVGMTTMRKYKVVVRKLSALEALGGVTNICTDKTGTLTQGRMITRQVLLPSCGTYEVKGVCDAKDPYSGAVYYRNHNSADNPQTSFSISVHLSSFLRAISLCNLATVRRDPKTKQWKSIGDPTEVALQIFAHRFKGYGKPHLEASGWKQEEWFPFDSSIKRMTTIYSHEKLFFGFTKGAVESVLGLCQYYLTESCKMTSEKQEFILERTNDMAAKGLRVIGVAYRSYDVIPTLREVGEDHLTFVGLAGLYDPPRTESRDAIKECHEAGIKVHMLTGDYPKTAAAIAQEVNLVPGNIHSLPKSVSDSLIYTATQFDAMSEQEIDALPTLPLVIARCSPDTKTRMIAALHRRHAFAAMTGDGVNDAPSLQAADIGISMGLTGSDVAKNASDIVLTDDNFRSIVNAVKEGRRMFDNIQRFALHLLASNVAEVILLIIGLAFRDADDVSVFPLSPLQILWINMLTSSFPAFGLGREPAAMDIMRRPPHQRTIFVPEVLTDMLVYGVLMGGMTLLSFALVIFATPEPVNLGHDCNRSFNPDCVLVFRARATVFVELTWLILVSAWEIKSLRRSLLALNPTTLTAPTPIKDLYKNHFLFWAVILGALSVVPAVYIPGLNTDLFKHAPITWEWAVATGAVVMFLMCIETWKMLKRRFAWFNNRPTLQEHLLPMDQTDVRALSNYQGTEKPDVS